MFLWWQQDFPAAVVQIHRMSLNLLQVCDGESRVRANNIEKTSWPENVKIEN
jgi:hypothetical protein